MSSEHESPEDPDDADPLAALFGGAVPPQMREALESMGLDKMDPAMMRQVQAQIQAMMSGPDEGPVNSDLARDTARRVVAENGDTSLSARTVGDVANVVQVANLWIDEVTDFPAAGGGGTALSRAEWVEQTLPVWRSLTEPVAIGVRTAMSSAMEGQMKELGEAGEGTGGIQLPGMPPGMNPADLMGQMQPMVARMSSAMFGAQVGQAVGGLAGEIVSGTEVGLPLMPGEQVALLPANVALFADGLE
ncbi:MAG: zinc-dependent metalloprotease, partial [Ornithinimicrobium sp.]